MVSRQTNVLTAANLVIHPQIVNSQPFALDEQEIIISKIARLQKRINTCVTTVRDAMLHVVDYVQL